MAVRYPGHMVHTRPQAAALCVTVALVVLPLAIWRAAAQPAGVGITLVALAAAPFVIAFQAWRFLNAEERVHQEPTPGMLFVFRLLASTPLTVGALLVVLLLGLF